MEFKALKNIETSFRQIRLFSIVFLCLCAAVTGYSVWSSYSFAEKQRQKIYVLDGGKSLMLALSQDLSQNRPVEAKEHAASMNFSLPCHPIRMPSRAIYSGLCSWWTKAPSATTRTYPRKGTITVWCPATSTRWCGWTVSTAILIPIPTRRSPMPAR